MYMCLFLPLMFHLLIITRYKNFFDHWGSPPTPRQVCAHQSLFHLLNFHASLDAPENFMCTHTYTRDLEI